MIGALVIHLPRAVARAPQVARVVAASPVPTEPMRGVDGRVTAPDVLMRRHVPATHRPRYPVAPTPDEAGALLSHRRAWRRCLAEGWSALLVFADDAALDPAPFDRALALARAHAGEGAVMFPHAPPGLGEVVARDGDAAVVRPRRVPRAAAALWSRAACAAMLRATERFDRPLDALVAMPWATGLHPLAAWPSGVREVSDGLGGSTIRRPPAWRLALYRAAVRARARRAS